MRARQCGRRRGKRRGQRLAFAGRQLGHPPAQHRPGGHKLHLVRRQTQLSRGDRADQGEAACGKRRRDPGPQPRAQRGRLASGASAQSAASRACASASLATRAAPRRSTGLRRAWQQRGRGPQMLLHQARRAGVSFRIRYRLQPGRGGRRGTFSPWPLAGLGREADQGVGSEGKRLARGSWRKFLPRDPSPRPPLARGGGASHWSHHAQPRSQVEPPQEQLPCTARDPPRQRPVAVLETHIHPLPDPVLLPPCGSFTSTSNTTSSARRC